MTVLGGKLTLSPAMNHEYKNAMARIRRSHPHLSLAMRKSMAMKEIEHRGGYSLAGARKRKVTAKKHVGRPRKHMGGYELAGAHKRKVAAKRHVGRPRKHMGGYGLAGAILGGYELAGARKKKAVGRPKKTAVRGKHTDNKKVKDLIKMLGL